MITDARLWVMVGQLEHEVTVAARNGRTDDYPALCADAKQALLELLTRRSRDDPNTRHLSIAEIQKLMGRTDGR